MSCMLMHLAGSSPNGCLGTYIKAGAVAGSSGISGIAAPDPCPSFQPGFMFWPGVYMDNAVVGSGLGGSRVQSFGQVRSACMYACMCIRLYL